jgi:hypothetical protein
MTGIPTVCARCDVPLDAQNITGMCSECKHIARDARAGYIAAEVKLDQARAAFLAVFGNRYRPLDVSAVYGDTCRCGRFRARYDTRKCEWCGRPWRKFPAKRTKRKHIASITGPEVNC